MVSSLQRIAVSWFSFWIVIAACGLYLLYPIRQKLRFGIDLVGGTYITLEVQSDKAIESELIVLMQAMAAALEKEDIYPTHKVVENNRARNGAVQILFTFSDAKEVSSALQKLRDFQKEGIEITTEDTNIIVQCTKNREKAIEQAAVVRNIEVLRTRLDKLSVSEISIAAQGERRIAIELPDVSDPRQAKAMIGTSAVLELKLVEKVGRSEEDILFELDGDLPGDMMIVQDSSDGDHARYYAVSRYPDITGDLLLDAHATIDPQHNQWVVSFQLNSEGGKKFYDVTSKNKDRQLAIILDDKVISAPVIRTTIQSSGQISGSFTAQGAKELATLLKSGAFVAPVTFEEERQVGPSLGYESIRSGMLACVVGLVLLFLFSITIYKVAGLLAFLALLFNLLLILLGMAWLRATLTLPGIAGMILTVGMAIDASILIFERIKEELRSGMALPQAVSSGFSDAMMVILDSNITTLVVGIVLYKFGTGPVQGFAVTMILGIIATLITGLLFLKSLFTIVLDIVSVRFLKI